MSPGSPLEVSERGVRISIRLSPGARREGVVGIVLEADGRRALKVAVTAPPERGRANAALIALLARQWRIPKSSLEILVGAGTRRKTVLLHGDGAALAARIAPSLATE